jgi:hypothetical protein
MDLHAIEALASEIRQEGRVNIEYLTAIVFGDLVETYETGEQNPVDLRIFEQLVDPVRELWAVFAVIENLCSNSESACALDSARSLVAGDGYGDFSFEGALEDVTGDIFHCTSASGEEYPEAGERIVHLECPAAGSSCAAI